MVVSESLNVTLDGSQVGSTLKGLRIRLFLYVTEFYQCARNKTQILIQLDEIEDDDIGNLKTSEELPKVYKETFPNMPETTRIQLSRNLDGKECTVRQLTSALQFKSQRDEKMVENDKNLCDVKLEVDTLRKRTLKYFYDLDNGKRTDIDANGVEIIHKGNLKRFR